MESQRIQYETSDKTIWWDVEAIAGREDKKHRKLDLDTIAKLIQSHHDTEEHYLRIEYEMIQNGTFTEEMIGIDRRIPILEELYKQQHIEALDWTKWIGNGIVVDPNIEYIDDNTKKFIITENRDILWYSHPKFGNYVDRRIKQPIPTIRYSVNEIQTYLNGHFSK